LRVIRSLCAAFALSYLASAAGAAPKTYVLTGKFTSNRGSFINIPAVGDTPCGGTGLSNLQVMTGPGLTGHSVLSMTMTMQPNPTPAVHPNSVGANATSMGFDRRCAGGVPRPVVTTGAGVGGAFTLPTMLINHPAPGKAACVPVKNAPGIVQLATSFAITGPHKVGTLLMSTNPTLSPGAKWKANWGKFQRNAYAQQTGRAQGAMFSYCWGNPGCNNVTQGSKRVIVKYAGGGNNFGGTMSAVVSSGPNQSSLAIGVGGVGFALLEGMGSQPTGRGYAARLTDLLNSGPQWGKYMVGTMGCITTVNNYLGMVFPPANNYNRGFPWTTMTVLARNTGSFAGPKDTTLTAKGGDTVTAMGMRNVSLVAGGMAQAVLGAPVQPTPEIGQLYLPEPSGVAQRLAGALGLLGIAALRRQRRR
jgi:hypothetical protein